MDDQRVCKYPLLLKQLAKQEVEGDSESSSSSSSSIKEDMRTALEQVEIIVEAINDANGMVQYHILSEIQGRFHQVQTKIKNRER